MRKIIPCLVVIPILWYFTYAPLHELSHAAGTYLVGGKVIEYRFIPRFWLGEFGGAWATPSGYTQIEEIKINIQSPTLKSRALYILKILKGKEIAMKNFWLVGCDTV